MFFRDLKMKPGVVPTTALAHAMLPIRLPGDEAKAAFADPLARQLAAAGLGVVDECRARLRTVREVGGVDLFLALTRAEADDLKTIADMLEHLGTPKGSVLRLVDGVQEISFGRSVGLGVYLDHRRVRTEAETARLARTCARAMEGLTTFHGTSRVHDRIALYFYGDNYGAMRTHLGQRVGRLPAMQGAVTRRLN